MHCNIFVRISSLVLYKNTAKHRAASNARIQASSMPATTAHGTPLPFLSVQRELDTCGRICHGSPELRAPGPCSPVPTPSCSAPGPSQG